MNSQPTSAAPQCSTAFHWKVTLLCLLTFPVLMALGFWQLDRAEQKRAREAALDAVRTQPPATLPGTDLAQIEEQRRLLLQGHYLTGHNWLLDNRQRDGQVGYEVITPFELSDGRILLINRGWVAAGERRADRPDPPAPEGEHTLFARWQAPSDHPLLDGRTADAGWPKVIVAIDPEAMVEAFESPVLDHYARLDDGSPGALITGWQDLEVSAAKHLGYAVQWFAMAAAVVIWLLATLMGLRKGRRTTTANSAECGSGSSPND
ncbi:SURF1 family protein [Marinimicrobium sp. LS-A18]|uniref:SURF1 family protein n=1 Tax=Marinimicrobium sp. LS-A18 TaxID=1381596 RepID=UPI0004651390|nr:SURF1 family protein [Marinimicrobium sp. LS-A18]